MANPNAEKAGTLGRQIAGALESVTLHKVREIGFRNARADGPAIARGRSIAALVDSPLAAGDAALVVAAGPSLHRQDAARFLKAHTFGGKLIVAESSMSWCFRNGIRPDLVVTLDPHPTRIVRWFGDPDLDEAKALADDYYARQDLDPHFRREIERNRELVKLIDRHGRGLAIAVASSASEAVVRRAEQAGMDVYWWNPMYDDYDLPGSLTRQIHEMNGLPCLNAGGNVGAACWVFAHAVLGKQRVGLTGVDFGYYADTEYQRTQYYNEIVAMVGPDRLDEVFVWLDKNPHLGRKFYTDPAYLWYRDCFLEMAAQAECETWNCTEGGILFGPGIRWTSLQEFLTTGGRPRVAA